MARRLLKGRAMNVRNSLWLALSSIAFAVVLCGCGGGSSSSTEPTTGSTTTTTTGSTSGSGGGSGATATAPSSGDAGGATGTSPTNPTTPAHALHKRCAWIGADTFAAGKAAFLANPDWFDAIHPVWFFLTADGSLKASAFVDDAELVAAAKAHGVKIMPLVDGNSTTYMRAAMATATTIAAHASMLATLAQTHGYDGLELDYEHLWLATDRAPYSALVSAVAAAMHAQGKQVTLAVPALASDSLASGYDYASLQGSADVLHLMAYDFHYLGGDHLGPIAPAGWVEEVATYVQSLGAPGKYSLGVANYGIGSGWYTNAADAASRCIAGTFSEVTTHMTVCPLGHPDAGKAPHCTTAQGDVWFENADSVAEKAAMGAAHGLGGVAYYTLGDEPAGFLDALAASF
jgi:chitinase